MSSMGNLSEHFNYQEFLCNCPECSKNGEYKIHLGLVGALELLEIKLNKKVKVKSAYRCEEVNEKLGGNHKSFHLYGKAAHIYVDGMAPKELFMAARDIPEIKGLGLNTEEGTIHVDLRDVENREEWVKEKGKYISLTPEKKRTYGLE
jgi:uncharacterized protein YcbK (DUF882 family)